MLWTLFRTEFWNRSTKLTVLGDSTGRSNDWKWTSTDNADPSRNEIGQNRCLWTPDRSLQTLVFRKAWLSSYPPFFNSFQGIRDNTKLKKMKYKFNGVKPLNKAVLANNDLVGAGSWIEFAPGLSQAKIWQDAAGANKIETLDQSDIRVLPGFGVSANPDFSSQGNRLFFYMAKYHGIVQSH